MGELVWRLVSWTQNHYFPKTDDSSLALSNHAKKYWCKMNGSNEMEDRGGGKGKVCLLVIRFTGTSNGGWEISPRKCIVWKLWQMCSWAHLWFFCNNAFLYYSHCFIFIFPPMSLCSCKFMYIYNMRLPQWIDVAPFCNVNIIFTWFSYVVSPP